MKLKSAVLSLTVLILYLSLREQAVAACGSIPDGSIEYNTTSTAHEICNGTKLRAIQTDATNMGACSLANSIEYDATNKYPKICISGNYKPVTCVGGTGTCTTYTACSTNGPLEWVPGQGFRWCDGANYRQISVASIWTWIKGFNNTTSNGVYGTQGTEDAGNAPGVRAYVQGAVSGGYYYLFGGKGRGASTTTEGSMGDLWRYNPTTNAWTFMKGTTAQAAAGVWGTMGTEAAGNYPSGRAGAGLNTQLADSTGNIWIFGGLGQASDNASALPVGDLWIYKPSTNNWTFKAGVSTQKAVSVRNTMFTYNATTKPSGRAYHGMVVNPANNKIYIYGGYGYNTTCSMICIPATQPDFFEYDIATGQFRWLMSSGTAGAAAVKGAVGVFGATYHPGGRQYPAMWVDASNNVWLWGGLGKGTGGSEAQLNDLWKFDIATNQWAWMGGVTTTNNAGNYGPRGVAGTGYYPMARDGNAYWKDSSGNFWLFAGYGSTGSLTDLWKFNPTTLEWTLMGGSNALGTVANYGVMGTGSASTTPGNRDGGMGWANGTTVMIFGGTNRAAGLNGDLWTFD